MNIKLLFIFLLSSFICCSSRYMQIPDSNNYIEINIKDLGAVGDGITNDYEAFKNAAHQINYHQGGKLIIPKGNYYIANYHGDSNTTSDIVFQYLEFLHISGNKAKISLNGDFERKLTHKKNRSTFRTVVPFYIKDSDNIFIEGIEIDGGVQNMRKQDKIIEAPGHLVIISGSKNIELNNLLLHHAMADGIYIRHSKHRATSNLIANAITSIHNARQGMSIISLTDGIFNHCRFNETGNTGSKYGRHAPSAGLDIEPHTSAYGVRNVVFNNCEFRNNIGSEIVINHVNTTDGVTFNNCFFEAPQKSKRKWDIIINAKNVHFFNCEFNLKNGSIYPTWHRPSSSAIFKNCKIKSSDAGMVAVSPNLESSVIVDNCTFEYTGHGPLKRYFPYIRMKNFIFKNNTVIIPYHKRKSTRYDGLIQNIKHLENNRFISPDSKSNPRISTSKSVVIH